MKVVIPVAGEGTRLRPHTLTKPKSLLSVAGKPILGHIIDQISDLAISEFVFVTGPHREKIESYIKDTYTISSRFVQQHQLYGLGYAVHLGLEGIGDEDVLIILGDTIVEIDWDGLLSANRNCLAVREVENPSAFGVVETDGEKITRLIEKPKVPPTNNAVVGVYYVRDSRLLLEATTEVVDKGHTTHGEIQLTDAFELLLKKGAELYTFPTRAWYDCGRRETILATSRYLLDQKSNQLDRDGCQPPCHIAEGVTIENSKIGPYVSIAAGAVIRDSQIENSIVGRGSIVEGCRLTNSMVGEQAVVRNFNGDLSLGDYCQVGGE